MARPLRRGDRVAWASSGGESAGGVEEKLTSKKRITGREVAASKENPEHLVRTETSGKIAALKAGALRRME